jgi:cytochrome c oxidase cbb3-type subunit III
VILKARMISQAPFSVARPRGLGARVARDAPLAVHYNLGGMLSEGFTRAAAGPRSIVSLKTTLVLLVLLVLGSAATALHLRRMHELRTALLRADPDLLAQDAVLRAYAQPLGAAAFARHCAGCHGADLRGDPARGVPDLADRDWLYGSGRVGELERVVLYGIRSGHPKALNLAAMPAFATAIPYARYKVEPLSPAEVQDVTASIFAAQHPGQADPESVARGGRIFRGKGMCFDCHAETGGGDPAIGAPDLTDAIWLYGAGSLESIRHAVESGLGGACPSFAARLAPEEARAIALYVHLAGT